MSDFWHGANVLVTGGAGFLGRHVVRELAARGCRSLHIPRSRDFDLTDESDVSRMYDQHDLDVVIHLAATCGGIGANRAQPGKFFRDNILMGVHVIHGALLARARKVVVVGTVCAYPKHCPVPFREEDLWNGYPEETNAPYGIAKKALLVMAQAYRDEYDLNAIYLLPVNLYGPEDNFDLETSHVIPAMIRKMVQARRTHAQSVTLWGDGTPSREFLYVEDCAKGIVDAAERYDSGEPVNLGAGREITMRDLAGTIARTTRYGGEIAWDSTQPNGQPRRCLSTTRALERFGWRASTQLDDGLRRTVEWYEGQGL